MALIKRKRLDDLFFFWLGEGVLSFRYPSRSHALLYASLTAGVTWRGHM